jgi:hypothetical protein
LASNRLILKVYRLQKISLGRTYKWIPTEYKLLV